MTINRAGALCIAKSMKKYHLEFALVGILVIIRYFAIKSIEIMIDVNKESMYKYTSSQGFLQFGTIAIIPDHTHHNRSISRAESTSKVP